MTWMSNVDNNPRIVQTPHAWMKCQRGISLPIGVLRCNFLQGQGDLSKSVFFFLWRTYDLLPHPLLFTVFFKSNHIHIIYIISFTFSLALKWAIEKNPVFLNIDSMLLIKLALIAVNCNTRSTLLILAVVCSAGSAMFSAGQFSWFFLASLWDFQLC